MYFSLTMGNVVDTRREAIKQIFRSAFHYHTLDLSWRKYDPLIWGEL